jgi:hypothetical protein
VRLEWRREAPRPDPSSARPIGRVTLVLTRDGRSVGVDVGDSGGAIEPQGATLCDRLGYRLSNGARLEFAAVEGLVSALSVGDISGSDDLMVVLAAGVLYILHGHTSDGMCESETKQGPLTVCRGEEYTRVAFSSCVADRPVPAQALLQHPEQYRHLAVDIVEDPYVALPGVQAVESPRVLHQGALP